jgi:hypothetical protein
VGEAPARRKCDSRGNPRLLPGPDRLLQDSALREFVDSFPMTVTGKVQKFIIREEMIKELGLSEQKTA